MIVRCTTIVLMAIGWSQLLQIVSSADNSFVCDKNRWISFKEEFGKNYTNQQEDLQHFEQFCKNLHNILKHNDANSSSYKMGVNQFTDLSSSELRRFTGINPNSHKNRNITIISHDELMKLLGSNLTDVPETVDWSEDKTRVTRVRNQGHCGSCWAFATVGLIEAQQRSASAGKLIELSEQNLVDCSLSNSGCNGGLVDGALEEIRDKIRGVMPLSSYPYVSGATIRRGSCRMDIDQAVQHTTKIGEIRQLLPGDEDILKHVVAKYGPVAISYHSSEEFHFYHEGVYELHNCPKYINHAMLLVGYGHDAKSGKDFWKVKNSWDQSWAEKGYGRVARNRDNNCGIAARSFIYYPRLYNTDRDQQK